MPPSPKHQYHMSDDPTTGVTFPVRRLGTVQDRYPLTEADIAALRPRSPDRQKAQLQAQESPGWSFVMKNEDLGTENHPGRPTARDEPPPPLPFFKRSFDQDKDKDGDKPRRHLLSFGKKKSKAPLAGSRAGSPRPIMPSPKRFAKPTPGQNKSVEREESPVSFSTSPTFDVRATPPTLPPKTRGAKSAIDTPLPPSPDREGHRRGDESPLDPYFHASPIPARARRTFGPPPSPAHELVPGTASPSKRSFDLPHLALSSRNEWALSHYTDVLPTRPGLRDVMLASIDLLLEDHYTTLEAMHTNQLRRISHLERSSQDASLALVQAQRDYAALEQTLLAERDSIRALSAELKQEKDTRREQARESTALIAQLENQLASSRKTATAHEIRVTTLTSSLTEVQAEIDRLEQEMTKGYDAINGRLSNVERLERDAGDWRRKAEEAEFTVRALREEGVRMNRELDKKAKAIEELEKGRKFVTRV